MNHLSVGYVVALTYVISLSAMHADEPPPVAPAQAPSPGTKLVLKPAVWTNLTPPESKIKESNKESNKEMICQGFAIDPQNPATIYLCVAGLRTDNYKVLEGRGLYKTTDGGATWKRLGFDFPLHVIIDPKDSNHLYLVDGVDGSTHGFWVSFDGGETWKKPAGLNVDTQMPIGMDNMYSVAADPTDFNHILVSFHDTFPGLWAANHATGVVESWDGGEHWKPHIVPTKGDNRASGCAIFFLYDPVKKIGDAKTWLFTTQWPEWYRTEDGGVTWTQVYDQAMTHGGEQLYRASNSVLYAGGADKPARSSDNGKTWTTFTQDCGYPFGPSMGICGDGTNIFIGPWNAGEDGCYFTSPETDGLTWKPYLRDQKFTKEPFEMHYDAKNGIMYASPWQDGFWALKIAPITLVGTANVTETFLSWTPYTGAVSYNLYRGTSATQQGTTPYQTGLTSPSFTDSSVAIGTKYYYEVTAVTGSGETNRSNEASSTPGPAVGDAKFSGIDVGSGSSKHDPTGDVWTFAGNSGIQSNGSSWGAAAAPSGTQTAFLEEVKGDDSSQISETIYFPNAGSYTIALQAAQRTSGGQPFNVTLDGATIGTIAPTSTNFAPYSSNIFTVATPGNHTVALVSAGTSGDETDFISDVSVVDSTIGNPSFEVPALGAGATQRNPVGSLWTFNGNSGMVSNGSGWAPNTTDGTQAAFVQEVNGGSGSFSQSIKFATPGSYAITLQASAYGGNGEPCNVVLDGVTIGTFSPDSTTFTSFTTNSFTIPTPGKHTLALIGTGTTGTGTDVIDSIRIRPAAHR